MSESISFPAAVEICESDDGLVQLVRDKITAALGMGIEACDKMVATDALYRTLFYPSSFDDQPQHLGVGDERYPDRLTALRTPLPTVIAPPDHHAFTSDMLYAVTLGSHLNEASFPGAIDVLHALGSKGCVAIWMQGDPFEQYHKMESQGVNELRRQMRPDRGPTLAGLRYPIATQDKFAEHILNELAEISQGYQVFVLEDRAVNIARLAKEMEVRDVAIEPIWVQQGYHGHTVPEGQTEESLQQTYHAVASIGDAPEMIEKLREPHPRRPLLVISDYDGVISDAQLVGQLQANAVVQALRGWGLPVSLTPHRHYSHIVTAHRDRVATS